MRETWQACLLLEIFLSIFLNVLDIVASHFDTVEQLSDFNFDSPLGIQIKFAFGVQSYSNGKSHGHMIFLEDLKIVSFERVNDLLSKYDSPPLVTGAVLFWGTKLPQTPVKGVKYQHLLRIKEGSEY